jgi:prolyl-tRNA synthetase
MICSMYAKWVQSWRDLPILINQWANVVRWEKVTRPFLRTTEFLWQEGHTLHATEAEAEEETLKMLEVYRSFSEEVLAMPVVTGRKTDSEKFAGALRTYAIEALMGDGKALQAGTSHNLGQHFATAYGIEFLDKDQQRAKPWSTSWGSSTRMIGGLIMTHGDDSGLILPPRVAPYQVVIVPIPPRKGDWSEVVLPKAREVAARLRAAGVRVHLDDRDQHQPGYKYADWEMRGVPLRLELGPKDIEKEQCVLVRRDTRVKSFVPQAGLGEHVRGVLDAMQAELLERARKFVADRTTRVETYDEFKAVMAEKRGFILAGWNGDAAVEAQIKQDTKATIRVIPMGEEREAACVVTGQKGREVYFAQAY